MKFDVTVAEFKILVMMFYSCLVMNWITHSDNLYVAGKRDALPNKPLICVPKIRYNYYT